MLMTMLSYEDTTSLPFAEQYHRALAQEFQLAQAADFPTGFEHTIESQLLERFGGTKDVSLGIITFDDGSEYKFGPNLTITS